MQDDIKLSGCDFETIPCKNCKWGNLFPCSKYTSKSCAKFSNKPDDVYYNSAHCPKFEAIDI